MNTKNSRSKIIQLMIESVTKAGRIPSKYFNKHLDFAKNFKDSGDIVTKVDIATEIELIKILEKSFPNYRFYSEELNPINNTNFEYRWIIDPIDGTFNFTKMNPNFGISLALEKKSKLSNQEIIASVIYLPAYNQIYWAEKDKGAFSLSSTNEQKIKISSEANWQNLLVATGETDSAHTNTILNLVSKSRTNRRITGSAAIDFAFTASGKFDLLSQDNLKPWDIAAGILLCREAGFKVINTQALDANIYDKNIIVINPKLLEFLKPKLLGENNEY